MKNCRTVELTIDGAIRPHFKLIIIQNFHYF